LQQLAHFVIETTAMKYFHDALRDPHFIAASLVASTETMYELGEWGGVVFFNPMIPGVDAHLHTYVWDPIFFRRPALARAILRDAMNRWDLPRVSTTHPVRHTLATRIAQKVGFQIEGRLRNALVYNGVEEDSLVLGILRSEV
jgi:RimJ/RimL family protein N-acetyltransferase